MMIKTPFLGHRNEVFIWLNIVYRKGMSFTSLKLKYDINKFGIEYLIKLIDK